MKNQNLAIRVKDLRNRKGFSQEQLSEESGLSLRTIQRIEKGESIPRGDTLIKLTQSLGVTPDDILDYTLIVDSGFLYLLNSSSLAGVIFHPVLGIVIPLAMWFLKREKINLVDNYGKGIVSFQITWTLIIYSIFIFANSGTYIRFDVNIFDIIKSVFYTNTEELTYIIILGILYLYNLVLIFRNFGRIKKGRASWYLPAIPFLK